MKPASEWDENYLLNLPSGESDRIEFKDSRKLDYTSPGVKKDAVLNELSKQISAFANSGGGILVFGIENPQPGMQLRVDATGGVPLNLGNGTREWLEDVIPNLAGLPLTKFNVYELVAFPDKQSQIAPGKGVYIIDIPSSESAPHQATDKVYYARVAGKSRPINHRFVTDIFGRSKYPRLSMEISFEFEPEKSERRNPYKNYPEIQCYCRNNGRILANYVNGWLYLPLKLVGPFGHGPTLEIDGTGYRSFYFENLHKDKIGSEKRYRPNDLGGPGEEPLYITRHAPVLPNVSFRVETTSLNISSREELIVLSDEAIHWTIYADNAPVVKGSTFIRELLEDTRVASETARDAEEDS